MSEKRYLMILVLVIIILLSVPYIIGFQASNSQYRFGGFLVNPIDGHSYLAKMQQGLRGEWKFKLPYTAEPGEGAYLFLFYLGLGQLSRLIDLPLIYMFHGARLLSSVWLVINIYKLLGTLFEDKKTIRIGLFLVVFGSGLGWLAVLTGGFTSDFWVAEAYPFLAMYTNPHFPLGLGIMIHVLLPQQRERPACNLLFGLLLGIVQPFAVVIIGLVRVISAGLKIYQEKTKIKVVFQSRWIWSIIGFCFTGGITILYQYWAILSDPVLIQWHQLNVTLSPTLTDLVISLSPCLILGVIGARKAWRSDTGKILVLWGGISLALVFFPWSLQRRFLTGIFIPLAALSVFGLKVLGEKTPLKLRYWIVVVFFLAIPTNLIILASGIQAISEKNSEIFMDGDLVRALQWIDKNASEDALILAEKVDGLFVPSLTGRKVIYGHPFETIRADLERDLLDGMYHREQTDNFYHGILEERGVDFVICEVGQTEGFGTWLLENWIPVYHSNEISIFTRQ